MDEHSAATQYKLIMGMAIMIAVTMMVFFLIGSFFSSTSGILDLLGLGIGGILAFIHYYLFRRDTLNLKCLTCKYVQTIKKDTSWEAFRKQSEITPFEGIGSIRLKMHRRDIQAMLGQANEIVQGKDNATDLYNQLGFELDYNEQERLTSITVLPPNDPNWQGVNFFSEPQNVLKKLKNHRLQPVYDDGTTVVDSLGLLLSFPEDEIEAVTIQGRDE